MPHLQSQWLLPALLYAGLSSSLYAVDGVILIDQNHALAGNVTPGDAPGFPVTISVSGSYRLAGNLTVPDANTNGILITADDVTLDLNGFAIQGPVVCIGIPVTSCGPAGNGDGVHAGDPFFDNNGPVQNGKKNVTVINGVISGMGRYGVIVGSGSRIENLQARSNGFIGISTQTGSVVKGNRAMANGDSGFFTGTVNTVEGNTAFGNKGFGIQVTSTSIVIGNAAARNAGGPFVQLVAPGDTLSVFANNAFSDSCALGCVF